MSAGRFLALSKADGLARLFEDREIDGVDAWIVTYYGLKGADLPEGFPEMGYGGMALRFGISKDSAKRRLQRVTELELLVHNLTQGKDSHRVWLGPRARHGGALGAPLGAPDDSPVPQVPPEVDPQVTWGSTSDPLPPEPASAQGATSGTTSALSDQNATHTETETDTDTKTETRTQTVGGAEAARQEKWKLGWRVLGAVTESDPDDSEEVANGARAAALKSILDYIAEDDPAASTSQIELLIRDQAIIYAERMPGMLLTPRALAKWWNDKTVIVGVPS